MTCDISRKSNSAVIKRQNTATKIISLKRPTKGSMKRLTLAVPELHNVTKHAADDICLIQCLTKLVLKILILHLFLCFNSNSV